MPACQCPKCSFQMKLPDDWQGTSIKCYQCGAQISTSTGELLADARKEPSRALETNPWHEVAEAAWDTGPDPASLPLTLPGRTVGMVAMAMLAMCMLVNLAEAVAGMMQWHLLGRIASGQMLVNEELETSDMLVAGVEVLRLLVLVGTAVPFCMWMYSAHKNLTMLGARRLTYTPGWAAGSFFVPILNLFRPCQIAQETWRASDPDRLMADGWRDVPGSAMVGFWWAFWLLGNIGQRIGAKVRDMPPPSIESFRSGDVIITFSACMSILAALFAILMIKQIQDRQTAKLDALLERRAMP